MTYTALQSGQSFPLSNTLSIQLIQRDDLNDIIAMLNDNKVNAYLFFAPAADSMYQAFFEPIIENTEQAAEKGSWPDSPTFVIRDQQGHYMGMCGLSKVMFLEGNYEVGYQLPVHAWGKGIATRACRLLTDIAFTELGSHKVSADCYGANIGSYKTMEKCGFSFEGRQVDYYKVESGFDDKVYYGITANQYFKVLST
ncbi:GNAT family N-acetyltransferase [Vibrio neptunius]|uniref:GNAT family N-acetyltransferase n=1 Tax=Vibrio neptunius TaxID=170651 RepID=A0ABS2ZXW8_9VIBR|nr:GNAT family protein [Vibrio neptunius]MBN3492476.1 GNAT family N-acetyltransferase [Vibrio neptunius]MBN3514973.1 GNAT family N-acetyltransferase [Vibrio neptunius]MBN3548767.1 GNAT family N-acetyltransferase [Vibrio neptunius]MBN3577101.1 GNAT family N-acetyltransferase [Vibrio neptunius]MCH9870766.1 GNAT family N-acetyltransferase [Vibrio neptunius]